jgi:hypothetical protein
MLDVTAYHDEDDDEEEFEKADKEESFDASGGNSKYMIGNKEN